VNVFLQIALPGLAVWIVLYVLQLAYHSYPRWINHRARQKRRALFGHDGDKRLGDGE
jgi:hypothetical protein